ncbi:FAD/NAD(P)-binding domain-containing protein [Polyplosphaeria fusca]|uniref:FAD/NAD(P)-binding domain-containing protein n=1 Tax=Polyplosphaeria fusca TaxID=682080 RepID=A0A9P4QP87_9PLEO|nr:FAD/NAD(P)-binding domain-containing protein [Polyplosphaeria fusca]
MSAIPNLPTDTPTVDTNGDTHGVNGVNGVHPPTASSFKLRDAPIENFRPLKVIVIGAGYSGIFMGIRIPEKLRNIELVIYDKNDGIGGTWWENRYLGCACDVPSHSYQFSFEPNLNWSSLYAPAKEIQAYLERTAKKYSVDRFIQLSKEIKECRWDEKAAKWVVTIKNLVTGETFEDRSDVLISARGGLNIPRWPNIDGIDSFEGEKMHSAKWNESYDFSSKRVAVIGTGSSSIQIVPSLQRLPNTHVSVFGRSKTWISPSFSQHLWDQHDFDGFSIPPKTQQKFHDDPEYYLKFRLSVEEDINGIHDVNIRGSPKNIGAKQMFEDHMRKRLESRPDIFSTLLPSFSPGCRRLTPGPGYLEALTQPNVSFITSPIAHISRSAVHTSDGATHAIDALVCATGFEAFIAPPFPITGQSALPLSQKWRHRATTYLSHSIPQFPNLFHMLGPNGAIGSGALTMMIESVGGYVVRCLRKMQRDDVRSMVVKQARCDDFTAYVDAYFAKTVFAEECSSWYKNSAQGGKGEVVGLWPGSTLHCLEAMASPRWEDYEYTYVHEYDGEGNAVEGGRANLLSWLGDGSTVAMREERDLAWYLYPEFVDKPVAPRPEEKGCWRVRTFSA